MLVYAIFFLPGLWMGVESSGRVAWTLRSAWTQRLRQLFFCLV